MRINEKPLSINEAFQGRRFKTKKAKFFEKLILLQLPRNLKIPDGELKVIYTFGVSSKLADYDNFIKIFQDLLQKKYNFNDNRIYQAMIYKKNVPIGSEFIEFEITKL